MSVAVVGLGYVGLPLAVALEQAGHKVVGFDRNPDVARDLQRGISHVLDVPPEAIESAVARGLSVTCDPDSLAGCTTFVICVPTPLGDSGLPDVTFIRDAVRTIAPHVTRGSLVVLESTSYPGTTEEEIAHALESLTGLSPGSDFCVAFSPERIDPSNPAFGLRNTPKIVAGLQDCCRDRALDLYNGVAGEVVPASGLREAELAKLLENTYRQVNIALMNEMAKFCHALDIDLHEAIRCAATKPFGYQPFYPGPGVGGHCIPIDPHYLATRVGQQLGHPFRFVELAQEINASMPGYVVERLSAELEQAGASLVGSHILLLGVAYKPETADVRNAPALDIAREVVARGGHVSYTDPFVGSWSVDGHPVIKVDGAQDLGDVDAAILVTHHAEFRQTPWIVDLPLILDTRGFLSGDNVIAL